MTEAKKRYPKEESLPLGYDENILGRGPKVPFPTLTEKAKKNALLDENGQVKFAHHLHFSLVTNKVRRLALVTANGIKGDCWHDVPRPDSDIWQPDPKIDPAYQILGDFYKGNGWDRGHLVRCADVAYGETHEEALEASRATFIYSNAAPQHAKFNQDEWAVLETSILDFARKHKIPVAVFTGPVFGNWDVFSERTGIKIPQSYWKVIALIHPESKAPVSTAFLMNQTEMWADKDGYKFIELCLYQVMVKRVECLTGLDFGELKQWDVLLKKSCDLLWFNSFSTPVVHIPLVGTNFNSYL